MIQNEFIQTNSMPYADTLDAIDPILGNYALTFDPDPTLKFDAQEAWNKYQTTNPAIVDTSKLLKNAINNLESIPFRSLLEEMNMPFASDVVYTAADIADATSIEELMANTLANVYQLGNLSNAVFVAAPFFKKLANDPNRSQTEQTFIDDLTKSTEPFEMISYPINELDQGLDLLEQYVDDDDTLAKSIVLHPYTRGLTLIFINGSNIDGMSTKQISAKLVSLNNIQKSIKIAKISEIISSKKIEENRDANTSKDMSRSGDDEISRKERVTNAKIAKLSSTKKIANIINSKLRKLRTSAKTKNYTKSTKKTFNKPNRREPDNSFKAGKISKNTYRPNLHLYLDTSGSMSIDDYKKGIIAAIEIAKTLKTDIYLSSFSDTLAEPILIDRINKQSPAMVLKRAMKVPVISGGTDFENVYNAIDQRAKYELRRGHSPEYTIILSDMEYWFSDGYLVPPLAKNTLHLMVNSEYGTYGKSFKDSAYNAGITAIDKLIYEI